MRSFFAASALLLLPLSALANDAPCRFTRTLDLPLQVGDARAVVLEVNQHDLDVRADGSAARLGGRACASSEALLAQLSLTQRRQGDKLIVTLRRDTQPGINLGQHYAWLDVSGSIPANVPVQLKVGSGDARVSGAASMSIDIGSGDVVASGTRGTLHATVGSGDLEIDGGESVQLLALGSGDAQIRNITRNVEIGTIGSGDVTLSDIGGTLKLDVMGSGELDARTVRGNAEIGVVGSGDVKLRAVSGNVTVRAHGSGDITVEGVGGNLTVVRSGSGDVRHKAVTGTVSLPKR